MPATLSVGAARAPPFPSLDVSVGFVIAPSFLCKCFSGKSVSRPASRYCAIKLCVLKQQRHSREGVRGTPSTVLKMLKQRVSSRLRLQPLPVPALALAPSGDRLPQFWQRRFYDFNVWSRKKTIEKLAYMHANPLKRGLVADPRDWPWSSYAFYRGRDAILIKIDPAD